MTIYDGIELLGGLALFLFGLQLMTEKLERVAGGWLKGLVPLMTKNRTAGCLAAAAATGVLQSSSNMTVFAVGLAQAGALSLAAAAGVIMGANIGTTATAFLLSAPADIGAALAAAGVVIALVFRRDRARQTGYLLLSVGVMFAGMQLMTAAMAALKDWKGMTYLLLGTRQPLLAVLLGAGTAAILQSSAAAIGLLQALAVQGLLPMETALYVVLGANIGTTVTAVLASGGAGVNGRRTAAMHVLFNVIGAAAFFALAQYLPLTEYAAIVSGQVKLQIALMHLAMNLMLALVLLPLAGVLAALSKVFVRGAQQQAAPRSYDERMIAVPSFALAQLEKDVRLLCQMNRQQLQQAADVWQGGEADSPEALAESCAALTERVTAGLLQVRGKIHSERGVLRIGALLEASAQSQRLGRHAQRLYALRAECTASFDEEALDELILLVNKALNLADMAQQALFEERMSGEKKQSMRLMAGDAQECAQELRARCSAQLAAGAWDGAAGVVYLEALHEAARAAAHAGAMAQG